MKEAVREAEKGIRSGEGGPFGAVIVKDGKIIGRGHNEVLKNNDPTCHGEIMAIHSACEKLHTFDLSGAAIYTTGYPCPMCMGAILWAHIDQVYYGCNVKDAEAIGFKDESFYEKSRPQTAKEFVHELNRDECLSLYEEYKKRPDKKNY